MITVHILMIAKRQGGSSIPMASPKTKCGYGLPANGIRVS